MNLLKLYRVLVLGGAVLSGASSCGPAGEPRSAKGSDAGVVQDDGGAATDAGQLTDGGCASRTFAECQAPCVPWGMQLCCG